jgi:hypothetical protein
MLNVKAGNLVTIKAGAAVRGEHNSFTLPEPKQVKVLAVFDGHLYWKGRFGGVFAAALESAIEVVSK